MAVNQRDGSRAPRDRNAALADQVGVTLLTEALPSRQCRACRRAWHPTYGTCWACGAALDETVQPVYRRRLAVDAGPLARYRLAHEPAGDLGTFAILAIELIEEPGQTADPSALRKRAVAAVAVMLDHGGQLVRDPSGGLLALFGDGTTGEIAPATRQALQAAEALHQPGQTPIRIGVNVGELAVDRDAVCGAALAFARALASHALAGAPLVSTPVLRLAAGRYDFVGVGARDDLGHPLAEPAYALVGRRPPMSHLLLERHDGAMVGRTAELNGLKDAYAAAAAGQSRIVCLVAPPGLGKSRLIATFLADLASVDASPPALVARTFGPAYGGGPGWAIRCLVETAAASARADTTDQDLRAHLVAAGLDQAAADRLVAALDGTVSPTETAMLIAELLAAIAGTRPRVLIVDDLHWVDEVSLAVLRALVPLLRAGPTLALLSFRPSAALRVRWALEIADAIIRLRPLTTGARRELIAIRAPALSEAARAALAARSDGNPLYLLEAVELLRDRGLLPTDATAHDRPASAIDDVPTTLHGVLLARIDRLAHERLPAIRRQAAILGTSPWQRESLLAELSTVEAQIGAWLDRLETGAYADRAEVGLYLHRLEQIDADLTLTALLLGVPRPRDRRLLAAIDRLYAGSWVERLRLLTAAARRGDSTGVAYQAYQAAERAWLLGRLAIAGRFSELALRCGGPSPLGRTELLRRLAVCARATGHLGRAAACYRAIIRDDSSQAIDRLDAWLALVDLALARDRLAAARRALTAARALVGEQAPIRFIVTAAAVAAASGQLPAARQLAHAAWNQAMASGDARDRALAAHALARVAMAMGDDGSAADWRRRAAVECLYLAEPVDEERRS